MRKIRFFILLLALSALMLGACAGAAKETELVSLERVPETGEAAEPVETEGDNAADTAPAAADQPSATGGADVQEKPPTIVVHVCGAVMNDGVYTLDEGSRVYEAVRAAGGFSPDADENYINQAEVLTDGIRLRIPTTEETAVPAETGTAENSDTVRTSAEVPPVISGGSDAGGGETKGGKVNINTADAETLCSLSGVGPSTAAKIIAYRESTGNFARIEDIMNVSGIKEKLFAKIKDDITV